MYRISQITAVSCKYHPSVSTLPVCLSITRLSQYHPSVSALLVCRNITRLSQISPICRNYHPYPYIANITRLFQTSFVCRNAFCLSRNIFPPSYECNINRPTRTQMQIMNQSIIFLQCFRNLPVSETSV